MSPRVPLLLIALVAGPVLAADPAPEVKRPPAAPQPVGAVHTLRTITEACARIEGRFTGEANEPYHYDVVRPSPMCQARAELVEADKVHPESASGWIFNDLIRVPSAACPGQQAVLRIWRHPADATPPKLDAQGHSRIYLGQSMDKAKAGKLAALPMYTATLKVEGDSCK